MILYIIKSTIILGILLAIYHFFLEKEKMHRFNRFYLLSGLVLAFATPLITVSIIEAPELLSAIELLPTTMKPNNSELIDHASSSLSWITMLSIGYLGMAMLFFIRFAINLYSLLSKVVKNKKVEYNGFYLVLVKELKVPHTFFHYVFINKEDYANDQIEDQLFTHEMTHAHQMHSLDIVLIELIQIIYWFNPLIYLYKRAIQLNHEFLADESVVQSHGQIAEYQHLLLDKAGNNKTIYLASNLNFSVTKKRLTMMTKSTNRIRTTIFAASTLPLFICLLMLFGNQAISQTNEIR